MKGPCTSEKLTVALLGLDACIIKNKLGSAPRVNQGTQIM